MTDIKPYIKPTEVVEPGAGTATEAEAAMTRREGGDETFLNPNGAVEPADGSWRTAAWLDSQGLAAAAIAQALHSTGCTSDELAATCALASLSEEALAAQLEKGGLANVLARGLRPSLLQLTQEVTGAELREQHGKFHQDGVAFELKFGEILTFFAGLEAQIGPPEVHVALAIEFEHTSAADSNDAFTTSNYGVLTTPRTEYWFVAEPERDVDWPTESKLADGASEMRRRPLPSKELGTRLGEKNVELRSLGEPELMHEEGVGARLYTGPMYVKYDAILRGFGPALNECKGNRYVTTIHAINSAIVKASKLTKAAKVYRGVSGGVLPERFCVPNEYNVKGGIETSFMSTSRDPDKAMDCAKHGGGVALLFEMELGMIDRGADISWLSQYPHEVEVLLPPLTGIELRGSRIEGAVVIYEAVLTINLNAKTLEQVIAKMRGAHLGLVQLFLDGFVHSAAPEDAVRPLRQLKEAAAAREGAWFNEGAHFQAAAAEAFAARAAVFEALRGRAATWEGAVRTATMCSREGEHGAAIEVLARAKLGVDEPVRNVRLAQWMVEEQKLAPPWPATFAALDDPSLAPLVAPLIRDDALEVGKRVLAYGNSGLWKDAVVRAMSADGQSIDVQVGGWKKIGDRPRTKALVVSYAGAGALVRVASESGCGALVEALLAVGVNPLVADERANTPLHHAAAGGHVAICRALLAKGADEDVGNVQDQSAAEAARTAKQHAVVRLFVPTLSDNEFTEEACTRTEQLRAAAGKGDVAMLRGTEDDGKITALMVACRAQQLVSVEVLLPSSELDAQSAKGCTALYLAAEEGDVHILRALLAHRAKVELADSDGSTPLMRASCFGHHLCGRFLLEAMADPNKATSNGWTALILAAKNGHELCVRVLLEAETDPNKATSDGWTALMASAISGHEPCVRVLLEAKADPNMATTVGVTALMSAAQNGHESCVRVLLEANADPNKAKSNGPTALMLAAQNGHESCVRVLLEAGADRKKEHKWYSGWNALKLAEKRGHAAVCDLLRE
jgi:ankyrin repeat protein